MSVVSRPAVQWGLSLLLGGVFLAAAIPKIAAPADFARIVYRYQVVGPSQSIPPVVANTVAVVLPWIELTAAIAVVTGVWRREGAALMAALLLAFIVAVGSVLYRGIAVENCGCFSVRGEGRGAGLALLAGDALLLAAAAVLMRRPGPQPARAESLPPDTVAAR